MITKSNDRAITNQMKGKVCLITGGTSGIGKATALGLALKGASVVLVGRNEKGAKITVDEIIARSENKEVKYLIADLASQKSIRKLAADFNTIYNRLDVLINNAGTFYSELKYSEDKIELQFAVNHLAGFLLTNLLLEKIKSTPNARIINVSSRGHKLGKIHFEDINLEMAYDGMKAYAQSKLANILFTYKLAEKLIGLGVTVNCLHPGGIKTGIGTSNSSGLYHWLWKLNPFLKTVEEGARTSIYLACSEEVAGVTGKYFYKSKSANSSNLSHDRELSERLWNLSEEMTGIRVRK